MENQFLHLCRICLKEEGVMVHIFNPPTAYSYEVPLLTRLFKCCDLKISPEDGLPQQICFQCVTNVNTAYDLRELSASTDHKLRKWLTYEDEEIKDASNTVTIDVTDGSGSTDPHEDEPQSTTKLREKNTSNQKKKKKKKKELSSDDGKAFPCSECGREFTYQSMLREHQVSHTGVRPYLCSICGKSFAHHASLSNHLKTHTGDKPHQCDMCSLSFYRRSHLVFHRRTHTGEKPFACSDCGRDFAQAGYLKEHMRVHSGEKPFVCEDCGHGFARRSCLVMHRRIHTGELPYACPECDRSFSQRSQRKRHVKRNHKGSPSLGSNGELYLREHDKLREMLSKIKTDERFAITTVDVPSSSQNYEHFMLEMPLASS